MSVKKKKQKRKLDSMTAYMWNYHHTPLGQTNKKEEKHKRNHQKAISRLVEVTPRQYR